jgi:predicted MFS family arabinose efflux permease
MEDGSQDELRENAREARAEMLNSAENKTIGCLGYSLGAFLGGLLLRMLFSPWVFYIGGHFSATTSWEDRAR